ncbi:MAG TPA: lysophospholipid acyltransferase family protein [Thermoanaerobaculia bacterium]|nr:lysophospholipid acyltransferase family protein [Thermoanaerobaculia bacterium]
MKESVIAFLGTMFINLLHATVRRRHIHPEHVTESKQHIFVFWHMHIISAFYSLWQKPLIVMLSRSRDGELIARCVRWFGADSVRGSSTRGGSSALRAIIREAKAGKNLAFTPDGPKGPPRVAKDGTVYAAQMTGLPIVPMAVAATRKKLLRSWDRTMIPLPFSKLTYVYGEPIAVPRDADVEEWRKRVEDALNAVTEEAQRMVDQ